MKPSGSNKDRSEPRAAAVGSGTRLVGALTVIPTLIRQLGADPARILAAAGVTQELLADPSRRIRWESLAQLLNETAAGTGCAHIGVLVGRAWHLSDMGVLGELMRHSPTVGDALHEFVVNHHLNSDSILTFLMQRSGFVDLGYAIFVPFTESLAHIYDGVLAVEVNIMRELCGNDWNPTVVLLPRPAPANIEPYRRHFRAPLCFDWEHCAIRFPASVMALRIEGSESQCLERARASAKAFGKPDVVEAVHRTLRAMLLHGKGSGNDVAQSLAMHRRTLNRRLRAEGTTFQQVLDHVRLAVAKEMLENSGVSIDDIAAALGYSGTSPFMRAFQRWTGTTPGAWRHRAG